MRAAEAEAGEAELAAEAEDGEEELEEWESILNVEVYSMQEAEAMCRFRDCLCFWQGFTTTTRVAPGLDYVCIPDAADHLPFWSLLVGVTDAAASSVRVSRLRVARSECVLGRSDDALEAFHDIVLAKSPRDSFESAVVPLPPDGRSLCVLHNVFDERPQAVQLALHPQAGARELPLPEIEAGTTEHYTPISADGHVWALSAPLLSNARRGDGIKSFCVFTRRLVTTQPGVWSRWEPVGRPFISPLIRHALPLPAGRGGFLQGYAVLPDANLILVSFKHHGLFLTFAPDSGRWAWVLTGTDADTDTDTDESRSLGYVPIIGRGTYIEQHKAVYVLRDSTIFAYKLTYENDDHGTQQLKLDPPVMIGSVCPFMSDKGYGYLTRLDDGGLMCSVWISLAWSRKCPCDNLHAIVTTLHLHGPAPGGIKVLHSTYRRVDIVPNPEAPQKFCFLQEYEDPGSPVLLQQRREEQEDLTSPQHVDKPFKMLSCCRHTLYTWSIPPGHFQTASSPVVPLKPATTAIKKDMFIICQAGARSVIYQTRAMGDDVKPLEPCYVADAGDHEWHFFQSGSKIHAVSSIRDGMLEFSLKDRLTIEQHVRRPTAGPFLMVTTVGRETIALTETLQVYHQTQNNYGSTTWLHYTADESDVVGRRVVISGYVAVNDDSFIVCDVVTRSCLLFDLGAKQWRLVMPLVAFKEDRPTTIHTNILLSGRCVFVDGFIYTCTNGRLAAYELLREEYSLYLSRPIFLPLSRGVHCEGEDMCLDYAGKDVLVLICSTWCKVDILRPSMMYGSPLSRLKLQEQPVTK